MSHFPVLVIGDDVPELLAPYDENMEVPPYKDRVESDPAKFPISVLLADRPDLDVSDFPLIAKLLSERWDEEYLADEQGLYSMSTYNPASKWDWYKVGGRWRGFFLTKPGAPSGVVGEPGVFGNPPMRPGGVDVVVKGAVDFAAMGTAAAEKAAAQWTRQESIRSQHPAIRPWKEVLEAAGGVEGIESARRTFWAQPGVLALQDAGLMPFGDALEDVYAPTVEDHVERARMQAPMTHAICTAEGWAEKGRMGWWGVVRNEQPAEDWMTFWWRTVGSAPDDAILTLVDCHI